MFDQHANDVHLEVARMLIERGADVSARDNVRQTPLHLASQEGQYEVSHMLIKRGASLSAQDKDGQTPLHLTFGMRKHGKRKHGVTCMLIERGASVSAQNEDNHIALPWHRRRGH